jgi:hypothetical protein
MCGEDWRRGAMRRKAMQGKELNHKQEPSHESFSNVSQQQQVP